MKDKEQLEQIKERWRNGYPVTAGSNAESQLHIDFEFLIQQAERVEELEKDKERLVTALEDEMNLTARMCELQDMEREEKEHYKQALEFYANGDNYKLEHFDPNLDDYMSTVDYDEGCKARQALERSEPK